jgi:copper chaperone
MPTTAVYSVNGMTCSHCVTAVTEEIQAIPGVIAVTIDLAPQDVSTVHVVSDEPLPTAVISRAVDEAGYEIVLP